MFSLKIFRNKTNEVMHNWKFKEVKKDSAEIVPFTWTGWDAHLNLLRFMQKSHFILVFLFLSHKGVKKQVSQSQQCQDFDVWSFIINVFASQLVWCYINFWEWCHGYDVISFVLFLSMREREHTLNLSATEF